MFQFFHTHFKEEEYEDDYDDSDPILTSTPKPASGMIPPSSTTSPLWSTSDLSRSTVIPTTEMSSTLKANDLEIESSSTPFVKLQILEQNIAVTKRFFFN